MSEPMIPINHADFVMKYDLLPEAYRQDYETILQFSANGQYQEAERLCLSVLARYDDRDSGLFREELAAIREDQGDISGARKILRDLAKEPVCADRAHLALARLCFQDERWAACLKELEEIRNPEKDVYAEMMYIRAGCVLRREGISAAREILLDGIDTITERNYEPALKDFLTSRLFSFLLLWDIDEQVFEFLEPDIEKFREYMSQVPATRGMDGLLLMQMQPMITRMIEDTMFHTYLEDIIDILEEYHRLDDEPGSADGLRGALESFEAGEDETANPVILRFLSVTVLEEPDEHELTVARWLAAKLYTEQPREFDMFRFLYPHFFGEAEADFNAIAQDPEGMMRRCVKEYAEQRGISPERAETKLRKMYEVEIEYDYQLAEITKQELERYPEEVRHAVLQARYLFHREEYDDVDDYVRTIHAALGQKEEFLQYIQTVANARMGNERSVQKLLKELKADHPASFRTLLAEGIVLYEKGRYRQAEKVLAPLIPSSEDPYELINTYKDILDSLNRDGHVRNAVMKQLKTTGAEDPAPGTKRSFLICAPLMLADADTGRHDGAALKADLQNLKDYLETHEINSLEEFRLSYWVTRFCTAVQAAEFGLEEFIDLIRWCEDHDVFADENPIIPSAYSAYESAAAYNDENVDDHLYDFVSSGRSMLGEDEPEEFAEAFWRAAETIRRDPECAEYMKQHYPNFIGPMMDDFEQMINDPEEAKRFAEDMLCDLTGKTREEIRAALNFSMGIFGDDPDDRRFS